MHRVVLFRHVFALHKTIVIPSEKRTQPFIFEQKLSCEHVGHTKKCRARTLGFRTEKRHEPLVFEEKLCYEHAFSVQNTMEQRQFQSKTDGPDAMGLSQLTQGRDLAKVDDFETLSLLIYY